MAVRRAYSQPQAGGQGFARTVKMFGVASLALTGAELIAGANVAAFVVPKGFVATGIFVTASDMDSGTTLTLSIGDANSAGRLVNASTAGQAGGNITALAATGAYYEFTADTEILVSSNAAAGGVAGTLTNFYLTGFMK